MAAPGARKGLDVRASIRRYPVVSYFDLAFLISWVSSFAVGGPKFLRGETLQFEDQMAMLMHASSTGFLVVLVPMTLSAAEDTLFHVVYGVALWAVAAIVVAKYGRALVGYRTEAARHGLSAHRSQDGVQVPLDQ